VISQDIEDTLNPRWSGCFFLSGTAGFVSGGLVVPAGVEGELAEELAGCLGDDADVQVLGADEDLGSGVLAADADVVVLPVLRVEANAAMLIDSFLDEAHLPVVHAATIGGAGPEVIPRADVERQGLSFTAVREHTFTNLTDPAVIAADRPAVQRRRMTYRYQAPLNATLLLEYLDAGGWQFLTFTVTPEDEQSCRVYQSVTGPGLADPERAESAAKYEMSIFEEDLDQQRRALSGLEFPLDPAAELHTRADRVSVEFRRVLAAAVTTPPGRGGR